MDTLKHVVDAVAPYLLMLFAAAVPFAAAWLRARTRELEARESRTASAVERLAVEAAGAAARSAADQLQPLAAAMKDAATDGRLTPEEADRLRYAATRAGVDVLREVLGSVAAAELHDRVGVAVDSHVQARRSAEDATVGLPSAQPAAGRLP